MIGGVRKAVQSEPIQLEVRGTVTVYLSDTVSIRIPNSPVFEWSFFGHFLCPVFKRSGYRMSGTGLICLVFKW
jgi:hypothetical protein